MEKKYLEWKNNTDCDISNRNNPYDEAGSQHNELVAEIESMGTPDMSLDEVFRLVDHVANEHYGKELIQGFTSKEFATPIINFETEVVYQAYINNLKISENQKQDIFKLNEIMFSYDGKNLCEITETIKNFENELLTRYKPDEIENVLISSSVGRYALAYWDNRMKEDSTSMQRRGFWKKFFTAVADAIGGAAGAVAGSATVVGGIGGGVVGAIGASTGFAKVWDIFAE